MKYVQRVSGFARNATARDTGWAMIGEGLNVAVMMISFTLLGRRLGPEGYGAFVGLYGLLGPAISFNQSAVALTVYEHIVGLREPGRGVARAAFTSTLLIGSVLFVVIVVLGTWLLPTLPLNLIILFTFGEMVVVATLMLGIAVIQAVRSFASAQRMRILAMALRGVMIVALAVVDELTLHNLAIGQIVTSVLAGVVVAWTLRRELNSLLLPGRFDGRIFRSVLVYSAGIAGTSVQTGADKVVLNSAGYVTDAGLYGAASRIISLAQVPTNAFLNSTHLSFLDRESDLDPIQLSKRYSLVAAGYGVLAAIALFVFAPLAPVLLGSEFEGTTTMIRWLAPVVLIRAVATFPANGLLSYGRNSLRTRILVANAVWTVLLFVLLIPPFSWRGAVVATTIAEVTVFVSTWIALIWVSRTTTPIGVVGRGVDDPPAEPGHEDDHPSRAT